MVTLRRIDHESVRIVAYDSSWPGRFETERELLEGAIGPWITGGVHHVGSTAVPGLAGKPVIDVLVGVESLAGSRACFDRVAELGYRYAPHRVEEMHWFCKPSPANRTHHLHLVPTGSTRFHDELAFRDVLRTRRDLADRYGELKRTLAAKHGDDREDYTRAKQPFVAEVLALAARTGEVDRLSRKLARWARTQPEIAAVAIVGSWARGAARLLSDVDVLVLTDRPELYTQHDNWLVPFGDPPIVRREQWGMVTERRVRMPSRLEVEFGIAPTSWASTAPVDPGTRRIVEGGLRILVDPHGLLEELMTASAAPCLAPGDPTRTGTG